MGPITDNWSSIGEVFVTSLENHGHADDIVNVDISEVMDGTISLAVGDHSAEVAVFKGSSQPLNIAAIARWCQSVDHHAVSAITLEIVEVGIDQGLSMVWLIEIKRALDATVVPVEVDAGASGIEIDVCHFGDVIVVSISGLGILDSRCGQNAVEVVVEVSMVRAEALAAGRLGGRGVVGVLGFEGGVTGEAEALVGRGADGVDVIGGGISCVGVFPAI